MNRVVGMDCGVEALAGDGRAWKWSWTRRGDRRHPG